MSMKIRNRIKNPTVRFSDLCLGQVYMTMSGDVCLKTAQSPEVNNSAFSLRHNKFVFATPIQETLPVSCELVLVENESELYDEEDAEEFDVDDGEESV